MMYIPKSKIYTSEAWLRRQVEVLRKSPKDIAKENGVALNTINRYLDKYGIKR